MVVKKALNARSSRRKRSVKSVPSTAPTNAPATRVLPRRKSTSLFRWWLIGGCRGRDREREGDGDGNVAPGDARREQDGHKQEPSAEAEVRVDERDAENEAGMYEQQERVHLARKVGAVLITTEKLWERDDGPPRAVRRDCAEESVRATSAPRPTRREHPGPLRCGGRRVHHGVGRGPSIRARGPHRKGPKHPFTRLRRRIDEPGHGGPRRSGIAARCGRLRGRNRPLSRRHVRPPDPSGRNPSVHEPRSRARTRRSDPSSES